MNFLQIKILDTESRYFIKNFLMMEFNFINF
jgi:hypothetical protein